MNCQPLWFMVFFSRKVKYRASGYDQLRENAGTNIGRVERLTYNTLETASGVSLSAATTSNHVLLWLVQFTQDLHYFIISRTRARPAVVTLRAPTSIGMQVRAVQTNGRHVPSVCLRLVTFLFVTIGRCDRVV